MSSDSTASRSLAGTLRIALLAFAAAFTLFVVTLAPGVLTGDSAELQYVPRTWGLAHPTGYPSYTILGHAFTWLPIGSIAYRMNLFSALCAALCAAVCTVLGAQLGMRRSTGLGVGLVLAASRTFWSQAVIAEVYALNALCLVSATACALAWSATRRARWILAMAGILAVGVGNHLSASLALPVFFAYLWLAPPRERRGQILWAAALGGLTAAAFYAYVLAFALAAFPNDPGRALAGFADLVSGRQFREQMFAFGAGELPGRLVSYAELCVGEFGWLGLGLALLGCTRRITPAWLLVAALALENVVYAVNFDVPDVEPYFLPSFVGIALLCGRGADRVLRSHASGVLLVVLAIFLAVSSFNGNDRSDDRRAAAWADRALAEASEGAWIFAEWKYACTLRYRQKIDRVRADLRVVTAQRAAWPALIDELPAGAPVYVAGEAGLDARR